MAAVLLLCSVVVLVNLQAEPVATQLLQTVSTGMTSSVIFNNPDSLPYMYGAKVIGYTGGGAECPLEEAAALRNEIDRENRRIIFPCDGTGGWTRFVYFNMTNTSQQCPTELSEYAFDGIRMCGRPAHTPRTSCTSAILEGGGTEYTEVCGRVIGYLFGDMECFGYYRERGAVDTIDGYYVDGITFTHGEAGSREHIWTHAACSSHAHNEYQCPCAPGSTIRSTDPPNFVGEDYFCESAVSTWPGRATGNIFYNVSLWDGEGCPESNYCECTVNDPPYFVKQLSANTTDNIEMRFCARNAFDDGTEARGGSFFQLLELYVK